MMRRTSTQQPIDKQSDLFHHKSPKHSISKLDSISRRRSEMFMAPAILLVFAPLGAKHWRVGGTNQTLRSSGAPNNRERTINISPLRGEATRPDANQRLDRLVRGRPLLLNGRTLRREYLPASVALDEHVRKARPSVNRLSLVVASFHMVDSRHDRSVSFNSHVQIRKFKRIEHSLVGLHLGEHFVL